MRSETWGILTFSTIMCYTGMLALGCALWNIRRSCMARYWPTAWGTIQDVSLGPELLGTDSIYRVEARYSYMVEGVGYEGTTIAFGYVATDNYSMHYEIYRGLNSFERISVRYDPLRPHSSCLSHGPHKSALVSLCLSATWFTSIMALSAGMLLHNMFLVLFAFIVVIGVVFAVRSPGGGDDVLLRNLSAEQPGKPLGASLYDPDLDA